MENTQKTSGLLPWYVHLIGGWSLGGLFPWYLVAREYYRLGKKRTAITLGTVNLLFFFFLCALGLLAPLPWDTLLLCLIATSLTWSITAWLVQYLVFGKAPQRYYFNEWKSWLSPLLTAILLGIGISVIVSVAPMIAERIRMYQSGDLLNRKIILWDFFRYTPVSFFLSIPIGLWWAGQREQFRISRVLSYVFGLFLFYLLFSGASGLFFFLLGRGHLDTAGAIWSVLPASPQGFQKILLGPLENDYSFFLIVPLLLGASPRIRDFFRKALVLFPLFILFSFCHVGYSHHFWQFMQPQVLYNMSSGEESVRRRAFSTAELLLQRFPEHQGWPEIAGQLARHEYFLGNKQKAFEIYGDIIAKSSGKNEWHREVALADAAIESAQILSDEKKFELELPPIRYESYMTRNWMVFIRLMRYYESENRSESQTLIRLKHLSKSDKEIKLSPMPTLAELYDSAINLGYNVLFLPATQELITRAVKAGFPVIQPIRNTNYLLYGVDENRSLVQAVCYDKIFTLINRTEDEELAQAAFQMDDTEKQEQQSRIDSLARTELPFNFWSSEEQQDAGSHIAIVFPPEKEQELLAINTRSAPELQQSSDAYLAALIGLTMFSSGDIEAAVSWSMKSYHADASALSLHTAFLAEQLWYSREKRIGAGLHLEKQLPNLGTTQEFLQEDEIAAFLNIAQNRFREDLDNGRISWQIRRHYRDLLDRSDPMDLQKQIVLSLNDVETAPYSRADWLYLAELYGWAKNRKGAIAAYQGALDAGPKDDLIALQLAYLLIQEQQFTEAETLLADMNPGYLRFQPDYYYCLGAIALHNGNEKGAGTNFGKALAIRKFDPNYHRDYAALLDEKADKQNESEKLQSWAQQLGGTENR